jgi:hypothetical protein
VIDVKNDTSPRLHPPKRKSAIDPDDAVMTLEQWFSLNGISPRTGYRILAGPNPPTVTELTSRRVGITVRANRAWQDSCARKPKPVEEVEAEPKLVEEV